MNRRSQTALALATFIALIYVACEDNNLVNDPSFDIWCGSHLCSWTTDAGHIERVGTWHEKDYGVSFEDTPTQISQVSTGDPAQCLRFDMIADVDPQARLSLQLDFNVDGIVDFEQEVPSVNWQSVQFQVYAPPAYQVVRFILRKSGSGRAVLAQVRAVSDDGCSGDPIRLADGSACSEDDACKSGSCLEGVCTSCDSQGCGQGHACNADAQCANHSCVGGVCASCGKDGSCAAAAPCDMDAQCQSKHCIANFQPSTVDHPRPTPTCKDPLHCSVAAPLGNVCAECTENSQCQGGVCVDGSCADCKTDADCSDGLTCRYADPLDARGRACLPKLKRLLSRGELCEHDADCDGGLRCGAPKNEPKRCGVSCQTSASSCGKLEICGFPALVVDGPTERPASNTLPNWSHVSTRISTCYPLQENKHCEVQAQCIFDACCDGVCENATLNLYTGTCSLNPTNSGSE